MLTIIYTGNRFDIIDVNDINTAYGYIAPAYGYRNMSTIQEIAELFIINKKLIVNNRIIDYKNKPNVRITGINTVEILSEIEKLPDDFYIVVDIIKGDGRKTVVYLETITNTFLSEQALPILRRIMINDILEDIC